MNKNINKTISMLLIMGMMTGCGAATNKSKDHEIIISTYFPNPYLEEAAKEFEKEHTDVNVKIEAFKEVGEPVKIKEGMEAPGEDKNPNLSLEDYITYLNTAFMGNSAPDLLMLGWVPGYKYAQSGYLVDLTSNIESTSQFTDEQYYMNVLKSCTYKDSIYAVPVAFDVMMLGVYEEAIAKAGLDETTFNEEYWTYKNRRELLDTVRNKEKQQLCLEGGNATSLFHNMYELESNQFVQVEEKVANFDDDKFITLLKECKQAEENGLLYSGGIEDEAKNSLFTCYLSGTTFGLYQPQYIGHRGDTNYAKPLMNEAGEICLNASQKVAITKDAKDQALCWEFIQEMLSEEMEKSPEVDGLPVNRNAAAIKNRETVKKLNKELKFEGIKLLKEPEEIVNELNMKIEEWVKMPYIKPSASDIDDVVYEETEEFFKGNKSAEEVAKNLQAKVYTMLNE